jgi:hypothetical protein
MKVLFYAALIPLLIIILASPLHSDTHRTDVEKAGLEGRVRSLEEKKAIYAEQNGDWIRAAVLPVKSTEFNFAGNKKEERFYNNEGMLYRLITYEYDDRGQLVKQKTYDPRRLSQFWSKTTTGEGSTTVQRNYASDGSFTSVVRHFDASGNKLVETGYDKTGENATYRWEREETDTGSKITYAPNWGYKEVTTLNSKGQITEKTRSWASNDTYQRWIYTYDSAGNLTEGWFSKNDMTSPEVYKSSYDAEANLIGVYHMGADGSPVSRRRYSYTAENLLKRETAEWYDKGGALETIWTYVYDVSGNLVEKRYWHSGRSFSFLWSYLYNSRNDMTEDALYDSGGRLFSVKRTTYNKTGQKLFEENTGKGVASGYRLMYEYDSEGRVLESIRYDLAGHQTSRQSYRYNFWRDLVESSQYNFDDSLRTSTEHDYAYDKMRNWIEKKTLVTSNAEERYRAPSVILFRTIQYFE